jgi:hypothetical protein
VLVAERAQVRRDNDSRREVLRGTWCFARSDGSFHPYAEDLAAELERVFQHVLQHSEKGEHVGRHCCRHSATTSLREDGAEESLQGADDPDIGLSVDVGCGRRVVYIGNGSFVQQRENSHVGRIVKNRFPPVVEDGGGGEPVALVPIPKALVRAHSTMDAVQDFSHGPQPDTFGETVAHLMAAGADRTVAEAMMQSTALEIALICRKTGQHAIASADWSAAQPPHHSLMPLYGRARWHWARNEHESEALDDEASETLEVACARGVPLVWLQINRRRMACSVASRELVDVERDRSYSLIRAFWFYQRSDGRLSPYPEASCLALEQAFFPSSSPIDTQSRASEGQPDWNTLFETYTFSKVLLVVTLHYKGTRALTFENFCQTRHGLTRPPRMRTQGGGLLPSSFRSPDRKGPPCCAGLSADSPERSGAPRTRALLWVGQCVATKNARAQPCLGGRGLPPTDWAGTHSQKHSE